MSRSVVRLHDKVAIVTGAGRGIGMGISVRLAEEGAHVVLDYAHSAEGAEEVAAQIRQLGRTAVPYKADVSRSGDVRAMVAETIDLFGRVDILVNNAGIDPHVDFLEMTEDQWDWILDTNLKGTYLCCQAVAREMTKTGGGKIVNVSSIHSLMTYPRVSAYAATKGGLNALTRQLALELAPHHINVNSVAPGAIHVAKFLEVVPGYSLHMFDREIPVGFIGMPEDVGAAVAFLASDDARYITGQVLFVDGGTSVRMFLGVSDPGDSRVGRTRTLEKAD